MDNCIHLIGDVTACCKLSHERYGKKFYSMEVSCKRESGVIDRIPVILSWEVFYEIGERVEIYGDVRTANVWDGSKKRLLVFIFAYDIVATNDEYINEVYICGSLCRKNKIRETPSGKVITDGIVAVNREFNKSYYIPSVFWGEDAERVNDAQIGECIEANGRLQSRQYMKNDIWYEIIELSIVQMY